MQGKKSMKFFMVECPERKKIAGLIEKNGGKLNSLRDPDCIEIVPYEINITLANKVSHPLYSFKFIEDSVLLKSLQDLRDYRMSKLTKANKPTRNAYKIEDDERMKKYVETHTGNPGVVKYWDDALMKGLDVDHTADSLRHHWTKVIPKKNTTTKPIVLPSKRLAENESPYLTPQKRAKEEKLKLPDEDKMKSIKVVIKNSRRDIYDFGDINFKCENEEIDEKFDKLVEICSAIAGKRISKQEVLKALVARTGEVKPTMEHFKEYSQ